ncbi:hypothetical protein [Nonomuraea insulae]|uniref:AlpA family transcriptional regulator n=1 Tax=Nonomuraea insulae TaxID=1616787 RepID=A0ABW1CHF6_9ACTN
MTTWNFRITLNREPTDAETDALYEAGLDDCAIGGSPDGSVQLRCDREAPNLLDAIASVLTDLRKVEGIWAIGVGQGDGVTLGDAARRHGGRTQASMRQLATGQRGPGGFPAPVIEADNISIYSWAEISEWLRTTMRDDIPPMNRDIVVADAAVKLACRARDSHQEAEVRHIYEIAS